MRAVAGALGSTAGSLYRYLSSRDDLLDLMVDAVLAELRLDQAAGDWLNDLVALADQQLDLYRRHPWLSEASLRGASFGPNGTNYFEECLRIMDPLDCTTASKLEAVAMITGMVYLFARAATPTSVTNPFAAATSDAHPYLTAALADPTPGTPSDDLFGRTIRSILGGLLAAEGGQEERNAQ
jgi:AcrR family transcriptional regulator